MNNYYRPDFNAHQQPYRRAQRRRRFLTLARRGVAVLALVALVALAAAGWSALGPGWVRARFASLRLLRIETLLVDGNPTLSSAEVLATAGLRTGETLIGLDLAAARARLLAHPWVRAASLRRRLPGTIAVEIVERVPFAVVKADRDYLVDREGAILGVASGRHGDLPLVTGVEAAAGALTARGAVDLADGVELIAAIRQVGFPALVAVDHIDLSDPGDAVIVPKAARPLVHVGRRDAATRLMLWRVVAPDMAQRWPEVEYVDLRADGQVVAMPAAPEPFDEADGKPGAPPQKTRTSSGAGRAAAGGGNA